eukprot:886803-Pyramimonas_sp.AAC.1
MVSTALTLIPGWVTTGTVRRSSSPLRTRAYHGHSAALIVTSPYKLILGAYCNDVRVVYH